MSPLQDLQDGMMKWINQDSLHLEEWQDLFKHTILISSTSLIEDLQMPRPSLSMLKLKHLEHNSGELKIKLSFYTELVCYMHKKGIPQLFTLIQYFICFPRNDDSVPKSVYFFIDSIFKNINYFH